MSGFSLTPPEPNETRFTPFREMIFRCFRWKWRVEPRWGGMESRNLSLLLAEMPDLTLQEFAVALKHLVESDDIPACQRPGYWLPKLDSYLVHPHNTFGRNPDAQIDNAKTQGTRRSDAAFERVRSNRLAAEGAPSDIPLEAGVNRRRNRALASGLDPLSLTGD